MPSPLLAACRSWLAAPAAAQIRVDITGGISQPMPIAIPAMPTPADRRRPPPATPPRSANQVAQVVTADLKNSGLFNPLPAGALRPVGFNQVTAPDFPGWTATGAQALVQGFVQANGDGTLTVGCYLYDVFAQSELTRQGFVVSPANWRRAAHKCADTVYTRLTGEGPYFDSRVVYVSETGPKTQADQAARDHGSGRRQSPLPHQRPGDRADAALRAEPADDHLHVVRQRSSARLCL